MTGSARVSGKRAGDRFVIAEVHLENADAALKTGMVGRGKIRAGSREDRDDLVPQARPLAVRQALAPAAVSAAGPRKLLSAASSGQVARRAGEPARLRRRSARSAQGPRHPPPGAAGEVGWVVKNPQTVKYYNFGEDEWSLISLFDGTRTRTEIHEDYSALLAGDGVEMTLVLDYEEMLRKLDLIELSTAERNLSLLANARTARQRAAEEKAEGFNPFFLLFHVFDPDRLLNRSVKYVRWIWTPPVVAVWCIAALWTVGIFIQHWQPIYEGTYELYAFLRKPFVDILQFFLILCFIGFIHEMSHAYATKIYGGEVHDIGIALLYFTPAFYCDTTDSLLFENKWHSPLGDDRRHLHRGIPLRAARRRSGSRPIPTLSCTSSPTRRCSSPGSRPSFSTSTR